MCSVPDFYDLLTPSEREEYQELARRVGSPENRYNRNRRLVTLQEQLDDIRSFCIRHDGRDSERSLVCGICWLSDNTIAINVRQLIRLFRKSKSSINGALAKLTYETVPTKDEDEQALFNTLPYLRAHYLEQRQWTIRKQSDPSNSEPKRMPLAWDDYMKNNDLDSLALGVSGWNEDDVDLRLGWGSSDPFDFQKDYECKLKVHSMDEDFGQGWLLYSM